MTFYKRKDIFNRCYDFSKTKVDESGNFLFKCDDNGKYFLYIKDEKIEVPHDAFVVKSNADASDIYFIKRENFHKHYYFDPEKLNIWHLGVDKGFLGFVARRHVYIDCYDFAITSLDDDNKPLYHYFDGENFYLSLELPQLEKASLAHVDNKKASLTRADNKKDDLIKIPHDAFVAKDETEELTKLYIIERDKFFEIYTEMPTLQKLSHTCFCK